MARTHLDYLLAALTLTSCPGPAPQHDPAGSGADITTGGTGPGSGASGPGTGATGSGGIGNGGSGASTGGTGGSGAVGGDGGNGGMGASGGTGGDSTGGDATGGTGGLGGDPTGGTGGLGGDPTGGLGGTGGDGGTGGGTSCGDGMREGSEACDDADTSPGDGCSATCTVESGWTCTTPLMAPSTCQEACGEGAVVPGGKVCFATPQTYAHTGMPSAADVDGDGDHDIFMEQPDWWPGGTGATTGLARINQPVGTFATTLPFLPSQITSARPFNFENGDTKADLAGLSGQYSFTLMASTAGGVHQAISFLTLGDEYPLGGFGHLNGDSLPDLLLITKWGNVRTLIQPPGGFVSGQEVPNPPTNPPVHPPLNGVISFLPTVADWDGDGDVDLLATGMWTAGGALSLHRNSGGVFTTAGRVTTSVGTCERPVVTYPINVNDDALLDVVVSCDPLSPTQIATQVLVQNADHTFTAVLSLQTATWQPSNGADKLWPSIGDLDNDGISDLVVGFNEPGNGRAFLYRGLPGAGTFAAGELVALAGGPLTVFDANGDGATDLAVVSGSSVLVLLQ